MTHSATIAPPELDELCVNTLRFLAVDAVQKAKSGHPGLPLGSAAMAYALWDRFLKFKPNDPLWPDRDRFILSAGHGCALLYALLHVTGYDLPLEELERFRQWGSRTPGHPEYGKTPGVEATTGPWGKAWPTPSAWPSPRSLWQRASIDRVTPSWTTTPTSWPAMATWRKGSPPRPDQRPVTCGWASSSSSMPTTTSRSKAARSWPLPKTVWPVSPLSAGTSSGSRIATTSTRSPTRLEAARQETGRPSLIQVRTHIGFGSPHKQDTAAAHGEPLGVEEVRLTKEGLGWPVEPPFYIPDEALEHFREAIARGSTAHSEWEIRLRGFCGGTP